jgi:hypothetical protein
MTVIVPTTEVIAAAVRDALDLLDEIEDFNTGAVYDVMGPALEPGNPSNVLLMVPGAIFKIIVVREG